MNAKSEDQLTKWEDQLNRCLDTALSTSGPHADDVRDVIFKYRTAKFKSLENEFYKHKDLILRGSELVGKVARVCADHDGRPNVSVKDMQAGMAAAVHICKAGFAGTGSDFLWCE